MILDLVHPDPQLHLIDKFIQKMFLHFFTYITCSFEDIPKTYKSSRKIKDQKSVHFTLLSLSLFHNQLSRRLTTGIARGAPGCWHSFRQLAPSRRGSPPPSPRSTAGARITSGYCAPAVSIGLGARMPSGWCAPAVGIRSGARMTSCWCPRLLSLVRAAPRSG